MKGRQTGEELVVARDTFCDDDWINHIWKGSSKTQFQCCKNFCNDLLYIRAIQGHTGRELFEPELMGHVAIPFNWKQFLFHRGCSFNLKDSSQVKRKPRRTTNCVLHSPGPLER